MKAMDLLMVAREAPNLAPTEREIVDPVQARQAETERILMELCQKSGVTWAPPSSRAATARTVVRAEEVEAQAAALIERQQWQAAIDLLRSAEPLGARGPNMLG